MKGEWVRSSFVVVLADGREVEVLAHNPQHAGMRAAIMFGCVAHTARRGTIGDAARD